MKRVELVLSAAIAFGLSGCVLRGKQPQKAAAVPAVPARPVPATPAPPPQPLSIPQTQTQLPEPQPISPAALATIQKPEPPPPAPQEQGPPAPQPPARSAVSAPRPEPPSVPTPAAPATAETERGNVQELVPVAEAKRLQDAATARKQEVLKALEHLPTRRLTRQQREQVMRIKSFLQLSDEAEKRGDMRQADALAERAQILMRELQSGLR